MLEPVIRYRVLLGAHSLAQVALIVVLAVEHAHDPPTHHHPVSPLGAQVHAPAAATLAAFSPERFTPPPLGSGALPLPKPP